MESWGVEGMPADKKRLAIAAWDRAEWFFNQQAEAQNRELAAWMDLLRSEFPLFNDDGLCEREHHCEFTLLQERKRLHKILSETPPTALIELKAQWQNEAFSNFVSTLENIKNEAECSEDSLTKMLVEFTMKVTERYLANITQYTQKTRNE